MTITKILYHPIIVLTITVVAIMFFFSLDKSGKKSQNSSENIRILEYEVEQISSDIIELEEKIDLVKSDQFKEKVVRNELLLQKPGEYILQIADAENGSEQVDCIQTNLDNCQNDKQSIKKSPLLSWKELLF